MSEKKAVLARFTPGPWRYEKYSGCVAAGKCDTIAAVAGGSEQTANGQLIAAAPEMFDALYCVMCALAAYPGDPDEAENVRELLLKAGADPRALPFIS